MMPGHCLSGAGHQAVAGCMLEDLTYLHPPPFLSVQKACAHLPGLQTGFTGQSGTWPGKADVNLITLVRMCLPVFKSVIVLVVSEYHLINNFPIPRATKML